MKRTTGSARAILVMLLGCWFQTAVIGQQAVRQSPEDNVEANRAAPAATAQAGAFHGSVLPADADRMPAARNPAPSREAESLPAVRSTVVVNANEQTLESGLAVPYHITRSEVLSAAGTWGDFTRYLQLLPGVVWNTDMSNDVLVRGGNPTENLYVVDGIEVPNINHISMEGTTGGFTSMIDTATIESVDLKAGSYDARFASRLSSLIEIRTREPQSSRLSGEADMGISGGGGFLQTPIGQSGRYGSLLLAAHRSVLNLVTNDIGINGVPIYTNGLAQAEWKPGARDSVSMLSLNGGDSLNMKPDPCDGGATLDVQTQYTGLRATQGVVWKHVHGPTAASTLTASYSADNHDIGQQLQATAFYGKHNCREEPMETTPLYQENTHDGIGTLSYGLQVGRRSWLVAAGMMGRTVVLQYAVAQPLGQQSSFNTNPAWTDADSFARHFVSGESAGYLEATAQMGSRWTAIAGAREEAYALTNAQMFEPRASLAYRISQHQTVNAAFSHSSQLAPFINILSYPENGRLRPLEAQQYSVGGDLWRTHWATLTVETYKKQYSSEPVSTEYPSLMLANMVDTLGQQFVWLPLRSGGWGRAGGVEAHLEAQVPKRLQLMGSVSYSRTRYAAADGVLRSGNFDFPLTGSGLTTADIWKGIEISVRDTYATGRPYTPYNIQLSTEQSRGIYDLSRINALRGSAYNRADVDVNRGFRVGKGRLNIHGGVENVLNRQNFLGYAWMDNCHPASGATLCGLNVNAIPGVAETKVTQMPIFPSAVVRYTF